MVTKESIFSPVPKALRAIGLEEFRRMDGNAEQEWSLRVFDGLDFMGTHENWWGMKETGLVVPAWIEAAHNVARGKRVFLMGTGPSLATQQELLPRLAREDTWTVNRMRRWYEKGGLPFVPTVHLVAEPGPIMDWGRIILPEYDFPEASNRIAISWWTVTAPGWLWCPKAPDDIQLRWQAFANLGDTFSPLITGWASPLTAAQLAAWMGYTEFYFLGCDTTQTGQAWDVAFGRTAQPRNIRSILECFEAAGRQVRLAGRQMYDCTPGGRLNREGALEYRSLEDVLAS